MNEQNTPTNSLGPIGKTGPGPHPVGTPGVETPKLLAGVKYDEDKPDYSLLPANALNDLVKVLTYGAQKYDRENWRKVPDMNNRYFAAAMRHMWAMRRGELFDPETGIHHAAHAMCSMAFICEKWYEENVQGATPDEVCDTVAPVGLHFAEGQPEKFDGEMRETEAKIFERLADKFSQIAHPTTDAPCQHPECNPDRCGRPKTDLDKAVESFSKGQILEGEEAPLTVDEIWRRGRAERDKRSSGPLSSGYVAVKHGR